VLPDRVKPRDEVFIEALSKEYQHRFLQSIVEAIDEGGEVLENLYRINLKYFIGQPKLGRKSSIKHWHSHAESYWENQ